VDPLPSTAATGAAGLRLALRLVLGGLGVGALGGLLPAQARIARRRGGPSDGPPQGIDGMIGDGSGAPLRVTWLGDSLAAGVGADSADGTLPRLVAEQLANAASTASTRRPVDVAVLAVGGARVSHVLTDQLPRLDDLAARPDLFIVSAGANDVAGRRSRRQFRRDYAALLDELAPTAVIVLSLPDMGAALCMPQPLRAVARARARSFDRVLQRLVQHHHHATHVDIATRPAHLERRHLREYLAADLFHPSARGYALWAAAIATALQVHPLVTGERVLAAVTPKATTA
jgi:lysophospholipase L1-like esterase